MTVSLREAHSSKHRISLAAVRSTFLLILFGLFAFCAPSGFAQGLQPATNYAFTPPTPLGTTASHTLSLNGPVGGVSIQSIQVVTDGAASKDFNLVPSPTQCAGTVDYLVPCTITISFTPEQIGLRLGAIIITNTSNQVVNTIYISGVGEAPQFVFQPATATALATGTGVGAFTAGDAVEDASGDIFFTDVANNRILEESTPGPTPTFSVVYTGAPLALTSTTGIAMDGVGNLYISSGANVYVLAPGGTSLTTLATPGVTLTKPAGLAVDAFGDLYIADSSANVVYQVPLDGSAAVALTLPSLPAPALSKPTGLAVDDNSVLYIADSGNNRIVERPLTAPVPVATVLALTSITLNNPTGVAVDPAGTVYIADTGNRQIVEATVPGDQFVLATVPAFTLDNPTGILIDESSGDIVVSDTTLGLVTCVRTNATVKFPTPTIVGDLDATDDPETLTIQGTGNIVSSLGANDPSFTGTNPTAFLVAPTGSTCPTAGGSFTIGNVCVYDLNFKPTVVGPNTANFVLNTTTAGGLASVALTASPLTGIGLSTVDYFTLVAIPNIINPTQSVELILTAYHSNGTVATDYTGTVTFTYTDQTTGTSANGVYLGGTGAGTGTTTYTMTNGVLTIPAATGLQLNAYGTYNATATVQSTYLQPGVVPTVNSNNIIVVEPATFTLTSSVNPSLVNQTTTFTLTITTTGTTTPGGTVSFYNGATLIGTATVSGTGKVGTASINDSFATAGTYPIKAVYTSNSYTQDGQSTLTQVVGNATSLTLTSSVNPSLVGQSTNLTATIVSAPAFGTATGTVQFYDGGVAIGAPVVVAGSAATLPYSFTTAGSHTLTAVYTSTNPNLTGATSGPYIQHVLNLATLVLTSSINPSTPGQSTTLTATLTTLTTNPGGTIKFYDGTTLIGTVTLPADSISVSFTTPGNHTLTAVYSGDANTETITSPPLTQVVLYVTTATLTSSINPVNVNANTTLTATVHSTSGTPTGTVTFYSGATLIGTGTLNGGVATLVTSFTLPGTYTLVAKYGGDASNQPATTNTVLETVLNLVTIALTSTNNPVFLNNPTVLTATLTTAAAGIPPTGMVNFLDGTTPIGSGTIVNGMVSITASFVYAGPHSITAVYAGDAASAPASSPVFTQTVADFSIGVASGSSSNVSTIAGGAANFNLVVTPIITSTFPGPITLTFSGLPASVTATITPTSIAAGSGATPVTLSATAANLLQTTAHLRRPPAPRSPLRRAPIALALLTLPLAWFRRRKRFASLLASILLLFALTAGLSGCISAADTGYYGETPTSYNLTVTATSGNLSRSTYLTLTVQ